MGLMWAANIWSSLQRNTNLKSKIILCKWNEQKNETVILRVRACSRTHTHIYVCVYVRVCMYVCIYDIYMNKRVTVEHNQNVYFKPQLQVSALYT